MNIVIAGGTGFIGRTLCRSLAQDGHRVTVLSRNPGKAARLLGPSADAVGWDARTRGAWERVLDGADAVVNLAGEPIAEARWTAARKRLLRDSRIGSTRLLVEALGSLIIRPPLLLNASAIGYYGPGDSRPMTEETPAGSGFLADLCVAWEREARQAESLGLRVVRLRTGMVLGEDGGALPRMLLPFRLFLGGPVAPGTQWMSWIHRTDLVGLIQWILRDRTVAGAVNGVAPGAVTMIEFCRTLGRVLHRPSWLPVPRFVLTLAIGELATLLTTGPRVEPAAAVRGGYQFRYSTLEPALGDILSR
ncbi:MAG: TIGR01777 family oxidoreductase [Nitrospirota bacterium]